ncbi:MAG: DUF2723 domain-containing protein [Anaerolineae bacterium]
MRSNIRSPWWPEVLIALLLFSLSLAVYNATLAPSLSYKSPDGNELATVPYMLGLAHSPGYPLYTWLGKLFTFLPIGDIAHRMNLMSAILGAAGVALLYGTMMVLTGARLPSLFTAYLFAFSLTFWSQTGIAEVYTPNVFMLTLTLLLLLGWARLEEGRSSRSLVVALFLTSCLVYGLSLGTHLSNLGFAPAFAFFVLLVNWRVLLDPLKLGGGLLTFLLGLAQFLWLPYKASTLNDPLMRRHSPATLEGIYRYTLGAFPQFKFAFPLWAIPDRIVLYLDLLRQNFGLLGIVIGLYGMAEMLFQDTRRYFLLIIMYLAHVFFFVQYRAFDLDVFFIPAHLVYVIFIGYGVYRIGVYLHLLVSRWSESRAKRRGLQLLLSGLLLLALLLVVVKEVRANYEVNDYSKDTAINDFYNNAFQMLPQGSVLIGRGGVFGYDMFYFRYVYNVRPDVIMPLLSGPRSSLGELEGNEVYTTVRHNPQQPRQGPMAVPPGLIDPQAWYIPVLVGQSESGFHSGPGRQLILYRLSHQPPTLVVDDVEPQHLVQADLGGLTLVGYDLDKVEVEAGGYLSLSLYWRMERPQRYLIATSVGETSEMHELGFGNLPRYVQEFNPRQDGFVVEEYSLVIPSTTAPGPQTLSIGLVDLAAGVQRGLTVPEMVDLVEIEVQDGRSS